MCFERKLQPARTLHGATPILIFNNWPHQLWTECAGPAALMVPVINGACPDGACPDGACHDGLSDDGANINCHHGTG